ncbi:MAG: hypothetical protein IK955_07360 [Clostridia bacterium]|nr:hypothetical protein [Clostridia bacterium]
MKNDRQFDFSSILKLIGSSDSIKKQNAVEKMKSGLSADENKELNSILNDKSKIDAILNSEAAKKIMNRLNSDNNGKLK